MGVSTGVYVRVARRTLERLVVRLFQVEELADRAAAIRDRQRTSIEQQLASDGAGLVAEMLIDRGIARAIGHDSTGDPL